MSIQKMVQFEEPERGPGPNTNKVSGRQELEGMCVKALEDKRHGDVQINEDGAVILAGGTLATHRFRIREGSLRVSGIVGKISVAALEDMIGASLFDAHKKVGLAQSGGLWELVAWKLVRRAVTRRDRTITEESEAEHENWQGPSGEKDRKPKPSKHRSLRVEDPRVVMVLVYADLAQGIPQDRWYQRTHEGGSVSEGFVRANNEHQPGNDYKIRALPRHLKTERAKAIDVLTEFATAVTETVEEPQPKHEVPATVPQLTEQQLVFADGAHLMGTMTWGEIAAVMGMPHQTVRAQVERWRKERGQAEE